MRKKLSKIVCGEEKIFCTGPTREAKARQHRLNMEVDLQVYLGSMSRDVHSCTHWLRPRNPPNPPHLDLYTRALLVSKERWHLFVTPCRTEISLVAARQAQRTNQGMTPNICTPWVPICLSFNSQNGPPLSSITDYDVHGMMFMEYSGFQHKASVTLHCLDQNLKKDFVIRW